MFKFIGMNVKKKKSRATIISTFLEAKVFRERNLLICVHCLGYISRFIQAVAVSHPGFSLKLTWPKHRGLLQLSQLSGACGFGKLSCSFKSA